MTAEERSAIIERGAEKQISWLKFVVILHERYGYLLNVDLALRIAKDAKEFVKSESERA